MTQLTWVIFPEENSQTLGALLADWRSEVRRLAASYETNLAGQRGPKSLEIFSSRDLHGTQARGVIVQELNVEEPKSSFPKPLDQMNKSDFGGVSATGKHRLAGEEA